MSSAMPQSEPTPIVACTVSRDVQNFDLLIEDMEAALGENWGDLGFADALAFFGQPEAESLEFIAVALDEEDEDNLAMMGEIIIQAKSRGIKVILIAEDVSPASLHQLLRKGADEFVPYPLPEQELQHAIERLNQQAAPPANDSSNSPQLKSGSAREGAVIAVHGLAGGVGATTMAVNLAWELANVEDDNPPSVCILDFDFQYGSVSTYLDLPRREFACLSILAINANAVVSKDALISALYDNANPPTPNAIEVIISRVRKRLGDTAIELRTVRGVGYMLLEAQNA